MSPHIYGTQYRTTVRTWCKNIGSGSVCGLSTEHLDGAQWKLWTGDIPLLPPTRQLHCVPVALSGIGHTRKQINSLDAVIQQVGCKSTPKAVLSRMQLTLRATRPTPHGDSRLVQAVSAWSVITRRAPSQHRTDSRVYDHWSWMPTKKVIAIKSTTGTTSTSQLFSCRIFSHSALVPSFSIKLNPSFGKANMGSIYSALPWVWQSDSSFRDIPTSLPKFENVVPCAWICRFLYCSQVYFYCTVSH